MTPVRGAKVRISRRVAADPVTLHDLTFRFWSRLTTETDDLPGGRALANLEVPYLLANAAWYPQAGGLASLNDWYAERDLPPAVVIADHEAEGLEPALRAASFRPERAFIFREARASPLPRDVVTEQVSWTQLRYAGEVLAAHYQQPELALAIGAGMARLLEASQDVLAFLSYAPEPSGVMLALEHEAALLVMLLADESGALEARLCAEARAQGKRALVLEALPERTTSVSATALARWSAA